MRWSCTSIEGKFLSHQFYYAYRNKKKEQALFLMSKVFVFPFPFAELDMLNPKRARLFGREGELFDIAI